jgi:Protein of unknown function (DUF4240)/Cysteine-rich CPCC
MPSHDIMDRDQLWAIVDGVEPHVAEDPRRFDAALVDHLVALEAPQIVVFSDCWHDLTDEAYSWDVWAAAWVLRGGCFGYAFQGFHDRLVALGRHVFERAIRDPDTLADVPIDWRAGDRETGPWLSIAPLVAFERVTGRSLTEAHPPRDARPDEPAGARWDLRSVALRVPLLAARASYDPGAVRLLQPCPCCGYLTVDEPGSWEICDICGWEDDDFVRGDPDEFSAPNRATLNQARADHRHRAGDGRSPTRPYPWEHPSLPDPR